MEDRYGRRIEYLRVSLTDRCNLRCRYCMPEEGVLPIAHDEILRFDEILRLIRLLAGEGLCRVRLTGGEPLVRKDVAELARNIKKIKGISFLGLTTNGTFLADQGSALRAAGVDGLNISIDTLDPKRYEQFTRRDELSSALKGLETALQLGFPAVKVNAVLSPESLESDWLSVVGLAKDLPISVRLIEWMPVAGGEPQNPVTAALAIMRMEQAYGPMTRLEGKFGGGPAEYFSIPGFVGKVGMIHAMSNCFCESCNRVRLTADGDLKLCLFYEQGISLKALLRGGATDEELVKAITSSILKKPKQHGGRLLHTEFPEENDTIRPAKGMFQIGG